MGLSYFRWQILDDNIRWQNILFFHFQQLLGLIFWYFHPLILYIFYILLPSYCYHYYVKLATCMLSCSVVTDFWTHGLSTPRLLCPCNFPSKNIGVGCHFLLQGIFLTREWTQVSCISFIGRQILYHWATWESPKEAIFLALLLMGIQIQNPLKHIQVLHRFSPNDLSAVTVKTGQSFVHKYVRKVIFLKVPWTGMILFP